MTNGRGWAQSGLSHRPDSFAQKTVHSGRKPMGLGGDRSKGSIRSWVDSRRLNDNSANYPTRQRRTGPILQMHSCWNYCKTNRCLAWEVRTQSIFHQDGRADHPAACRPAPELRWTLNDGGGGDGGGDDGEDEGVVVVCECVHTCHSIHVMVIEQLSGTGPLLSLWDPGIKCRPSGFAPSTLHL